MISIIIPVYNGHEMLQECLDSIRRNTPEEHEIVMVDNGSTPRIEGALIRNDKNLGFPEAVNQGIRAAKGDVIILLNTDVIVTPEWAEGLVSYLDRFSIVGPAGSYSIGIQTVRISAYNNYSELDVEAIKWAHKNKGKIQQVNWLVGFCMAFKKSLVDEIGDFDQSLWPCSGEEVDFCYRSRKKGHRIAVVWEVYVHHFGSKTFELMRKNREIDYESITQRNHEYLVEKWGNYASDQLVNPPLVEGTNLNLGCGYNHLKGYINIDNREIVKPDRIVDVLDGLPFEDSSVDLVNAADFLEHIPLGKTIQVMNEIWRVLKPNGIFESFTPDAEHGQGAFQDPTHVSFWCENSWLYFSDPYCRALYGIRADFEVQPIERIETDKRVFHLKVIAKAKK